MKIKSERRKLQGRLWELTKELIRRRDGNVCQWCLKTVTGTNRHNSHVIPKSHDKRLEFDPENIKILCFNCHRNKWHLSPIDAGNWFQKKFPERWKSLQKKHLEHQKLGSVKTSWFQDKIEEYKELLK